MIFSFFGDNGGSLVVVFRSFDPVPDICPVPPPGAIFWQRGVPFATPLYYQGSCQRECRELFYFYLVEFI
jgi:hypothetical protein